MSKQARGGLAHAACRPGNQDDVVSFRPKPISGISRRSPGGCCGQATVDDQFGSGDVRGLVAGQEQCGVRHIPGAAHPAHGHPTVALFDEPFDAIRMRRVIDMDHGRVDMARKDRVGPNSFTGIFDGKCSRKSKYAAFAGRIGDVGAARVADRRDRRDVDNNAFALALHHGQHSAAGKKHRFEVAVDDEVPIGFAQRRRAALAIDSDIVV